MPEQALELRRAIPEHLDSHLKVEMGAEVRGDSRGSSSKPQRGREAFR